MTLTSAGDIGIGTVSPSSKLTVDGTVELLSGGVKFADGTVQTSAHLGLSTGAAFSVYNTAHTGTTTAYAWTGIRYNDGSYDPATGRFTAPNPGLYKLCTGGIQQNKAEVGRWQIQHNGATTSAQCRSDGSAEYGQCTVCTIIYMEEDDYATVDISESGIYSGFGYFTGHSLGGSGGFWSRTEEGDLHYDIGNIGIGTSTPTEKLDVDGTVRALAFDGDGSNLTGITASSLEDNTITVDKLDFASSEGIHIPQQSTPPGTPTTGQIYYNTSDSKLYVYNGSSWAEVGSGTSSSGESGLRAATFGWRSSAIEIFESSGVDTITRLGTGTYQINWSTPFPNDGYIVVGSCNAWGTSGAMFNLEGGNSGDPTNIAQFTDSVRVGCRIASTNTMRDVETIHVAAFPVDGLGGGGAELTDDSVQTSHLQNGSVTGEKIASDTITVGNIDFTSDEGVNFPQLSAHPASGVAGQVYYNTTEESLKMYDGTEWKELRTTPAGTYAFRVERTTDLDTGGTTQKITWDNKVLDDGDAFDLTTDKFRPTSAGYYYLTLRASGVSCTGNNNLLIYKNGSTIANTVSQGTTTTSHDSLVVNTIVYLNGTTDEIEAYARENCSGDMGATYLSFKGFKIGGTGDGQGGETLWSQSGDDLYFNNGNIGIGSDNPSDLLTIQATDNLTDNYPLHLWNSADTLRTGYGTYGMSNKIGASQTTNYTMEVGGDLILLPDDNVGIGSASPGGKLDVAENGHLIRFFGGAADSPRITLRQDEEETRWTMDNHSGMYRLFSSDNDVGSAGIVRMVLDDSGDMGLGTDTPETKLHLRSGSPSGIIVQRAGNANSNIEYRNDDGSMFAGLSQDENFAIGNAQNLGSSGTLVVTPGGRVGVKRNSPSYDLDVNGTIRGDNLAPSDRRLKTNITSIEKDGALDDLLSIQGVRYNWIDPEKEQQDQIGLIAQDVQRVYPEVVQSDDEGILAVKYSHLIAAVIEAVKDFFDRFESQSEKHQEEVGQLKQEVHQLREKNESLESKVDQLESEMAEIRALIELERSPASVEQEDTPEH